MKAALSSTWRTVHVPCDGVELEGRFESPVKPRGVVIVAHGSAAAPAGARDDLVAARLRAQGFATLLLDLLAPDEDVVQAQRFDIPLLAARLLAAVRWAREYPPAANLPVGLFGVGTGAAAAIEVAALLRPRIAAVVSGGGRPELASCSALGRVAAPSLLIVDGADAGALEVNHAAYERLRCEKDLAIVPGTGVAGLAAEWMRRHLRATSPAGAEIAPA